MVDLQPAVAPNRLVDALGIALERVRGSALSTSDLLVALTSLDPRAALDALLGESGEDDATPFAFGHVIERGLTALRDDLPTRGAYASRILRQYATRFNAATALVVASAIASYEDVGDRAALDAVIARFPAEAALLRIAIRTAQAAGSAELADTLLTRLGLADPTLATVTAVHRSRITSDRGSAAASARIAFVSSYTIDQLVSYVDLACRANGIAPQIYVAPFNSWTRDVIDPQSGLRAFDPDITFLSVALDDLVPSLVGNSTREDLDSAAESALERVLAVVDGYRTWASGRTLVVHAFHSAFSSPLGILDGTDSSTRRQWIAALNARLANELRERPSLRLLDVEAAVAATGGSLADNAKLRHIASMRLPPTALAAIADAYVRYIVPARGLTKKCVVLDLDNTLWGGVVGEDGPNGIRLGKAGVGAAFFELQTFLKSLTQRGILLAINSKNNAEDALEAIRTHEEMVLRESAFSAIRINWLPKSENMISIAAQLNIGVDALVFVDDNPDERERMRQILPDVLTVDLPRDPTQYRAILERLPQLQSLAITSEDRERHAQYETARLRTAVKMAAGSVDGYLRSLEIRVAIGGATPDTFARVAQLFAKTNQFNTTTRRYALADVESFAVDPGMRLWTLASNDRFGDHGLVAVALVRCDETRWDIDSFVMSCRVIGYGIETALLAHVAEAARSAGATALRGDFIETKKNVPARELYARHGFTRESQSDARESWTLALTDNLPFPTWIERTI